MYGMMFKHAVSVMDLIEWIESNPEKITGDIVDEKIGDNINFLILLEGMLKQRIYNPKSPTQNQTSPFFIGFF